MLSGSDGQSVGAGNVSWLIGYLALMSAMNEAKPLTSAGDCFIPETCTTGMPALYTDAVLVIRLF